LAPPSSFPYGSFCETALQWLAPPSRSPYGSFCETALRWLAGAAVQVSLGQLLRRQRHRRGLAA
jgi:hypothetical protein